MIFDKIKKLFNKSEKENELARGPGGTIGEPGIIEPPVEPEPEGPKTYSFM